MHARYLSISLTFPIIGSIIIGVSERNKIMKKKNKKNSPNRLKCQISGKTRMSNKQYISAKGDKFGVTGNVWASFYISKDEYKMLVCEVEAGGLDKAAEIYKVEKARVIKWLRYNGRGKFVKQVKETVEVVELAA